MMKFTKRFSAILCVLMLLFCTSTTAFADEYVSDTTYDSGETDGGAYGSYRFVDDADLFTYDEETQLTEKLERTANATGWDVLVYTNYNGVEQYEMKEYCREYYLNYVNEVNSYSSGGVVLNIDMSSREMYIFPYENAMDYFSDNRLDSVLDEVQDCLVDGDYYSAVEVFALTTEEYYYNGIDYDDSTDNLYAGDTDNLRISQRFLLVLKEYGIIIVVVSIAAGMLSVVFTKKRYKNHGKSGTYDLRANSSTTLYEKEDIFLHKSVSVTTISSSSSGGGRSGGGGSRSGGGGGGRSF